MKWLMYIVLAALVGWTWTAYAKKGRDMEVLRQEITELQAHGEPDEVTQKKETALQAMEGERTFNGILLTFLGAGLFGIFFVVHALPFFAQRATHAVYDSGEMVENDLMRDARSLMEQGDYEGAITAFQNAAAVDPLNRLPWVEIARIFKNHLGDAGSAIQTIRYALESQEWGMDDAAYFLFRLAELYKDEGDSDSARAILSQVIEQFPETRHSANASHKLHEWAAADEAAEEAQYLAHQSGQ
ncbi:MAG TPA: tetratricopeptide repeat protein [Luteolibacter sp.]